MAIIRTVLGDIPPSELGPCYPHEHLLGKPPHKNVESDLLLDNLQVTIHELNCFHEAGGKSIVDMTPSDYNRNVKGLQRVSKASGVHIIATTGMIKEATCTRFVDGRTVKYLADEFIADIKEGIDGTKIRAGVIKAGSSQGKITPNEEKVFQAAAIAHLATGALISTHTEGGTMGLEQIELLRSQHVDPHRVVIGHIDRLLDWEYHLNIARTGAYLGFDQISKEKYAPDSQRIQFILNLVAAGFGKQILFSGDFAKRSYWPSYQTGGGPGLTYILWRFLPWLRFAGLSEEAIKDIMVYNPATALSFE
jgi:phosphotriesterase-related protein